VFQALIAQDHIEKYHAYFGSLGYALFETDPPDLYGAINQLTNAIRISDSAQTNAMYCYIRAACLIDLQQQNTAASPSDDAIWADLRAAKGMGHSFFERVEDDPEVDAPAKVSVRGWLAGKHKKFEDL
jgi:hypothetical protein